MKYITKLILFCILILLCYTLYYRVLNNEEKEGFNSTCEEMMSQFNAGVSITNINLRQRVLTEKKQYKDYFLRDFYIKTAHNCCAVGSFSGSIVDKCALHNCIKQGARCLDFQIFSQNDMPVIGTSSVNSRWIKESANTMSILDALSIVNNNCFNAPSPNPKDPLFLHFRIQSENIIIYDKLADIITSTIDESRLLSKNYQFEYHNNNLGSEPIENLMGKVIIIIDGKNTFYQNSKLLYKQVNITSNSIYLRLLRDDDVRSNGDIDELKSHNQRSMTLSIPNMKSKPINFKAKFHRDVGCQFIAMNFQNLDEEMKQYHQFFDNHTSAFVLKPRHLRYVPIELTVPKKQTESPELKKMNLIPDLDMEPIVLGI